MLLNYHLMKPSAVDLPLAIIVGDDIPARLVGIFVRRPSHTFSDKDTCCKRAWAEATTLRGSALNRPKKKRGSIGSNY